MVGEAVAAAVARGDGPGGLPARVRDDIATREQLVEGPEVAADPLQGVLIGAIGVVLGVGDEQPVVALEDRQDVVGGVEVALVPGAGHKGHALVVLL